METPTKVNVEKSDQELAKKGVDGMMDVVDEQPDVNNTLQSMVVTELSPSMGDKGELVLG